MTPEQFQTEVDEQLQLQSQTELEAQRQRLQVDNVRSVLVAIDNAVKTLLKFQAQHQPKVSVTNQKLPTTIRTPDVNKVVDSLNKLKAAVRDNKPDNSNLVEALKELNKNLLKLPTDIKFPDIPTPPEAVTVKNQPDYKPEFKELAQSIKSIDVRPEVKVSQKETVVDVSPVVEAISEVDKSVKDIKIPQPPSLDTKPITTAIKKVYDAIAGLKFPLPNYRLPFSLLGKDTQIQLNSDGSMPFPSILNTTYDDLVFSNADAGGNYQTQSFKKDGQTVATLSLTFDGNNNVTRITRS